MADGTGGGAEDGRAENGRAAASLAGRRVVAVLGMHRSGTSALARALSLLGLGMAGDLVPAGEGNEAGHWEPRRLVELDDAILGGMGSSWLDWRRLPWDAVDPGRRADWARRLAATIAAEHGAGDLVLKDPRLSRLMPLLRDALGEADLRPLLILRRPEAVAASLRARRSWFPGRDEAEARLSWLRHNLDAERGSRGLPRAVLVYDELLADWRGALGRALGQAGLADLAPSPDAAAAIDAFLRPSLRHHDPDPDDLLAPWCGPAWDALAALARDPGDADAQAALDRLDARLADAEAPVAHVLAASAPRAAAAEREATDARAEAEHLRGFVDGQAAHVARLDAELAARADAIAELEGFRARMGEEAGRLAALLAERDAELAAAREDAERRVGELREEADRRAAAIRELEAFRDRLGEEAGRLAALLAERDAELAAVREDAERRVGELREEAGRLRALVERQAGEILDRLDRVRAEADAAATDRLRHLQDVIDRQSRHIEVLDAEVLRVAEAYRSTLSWRVTAPLRGLRQPERTARDALTAIRQARQAYGAIPAARRAARLVLREGPRGITRRLAIARGARGAVGGAPEADPLACLVVTTPHVAGIARHMAAVLRAEGFRAEVAESPAAAARFGHCFVLCPQMFGELPEGYVAFQMEQSVSSRWFTPDYLAKLNRAQTVLDYSLRNVEFLAANGVEGWKLHYVPLDVDPAAMEGAAPPEERRGALFYGDDKTPRRQEMLARLREVVPELEVVNDLFGDGLRDRLRRAAVVVNVHYYEGALLETARLSEALGHGAPVVSEEAADQDEHEGLGGVVDFVPVGDVEAMGRAVRRLLDDPAHARARGEALRAHAARPNRFEAWFRRALLSRRMIGLDAFRERAPGWPMAVPADEPGGPRLCLSLPETPDRRRLFAAEGRGEFRVWDGLKTAPGWIGAAMSYKHMFAAMTEAGVERATVCEDDVLFPPDFLRRLGVVERFLAGRDWDVFSGFIADAHRDLSILDVEEFEGETFVTIDRTVSMVFNVYRAPVMAYLARWDEARGDQFTNTIDRWLEKRGTTRVVLALPFLVGHRPDATSTIWGFANTQYDEVSAQSERLLRERVAAFRAGSAARRG